LSDARVIEAVVFDLDGVLIDSEQVWDEARRQLIAERGGHWREGVQRDMMGMSSIEWSRYIRDELAVDLSPEQISEEVVRRLTALYEERLPIIDGAVEAVERLAARWRVALASSSNRELIDLVLATAGLTRCFEVTVSSEEVARGKPAPDVYLEAARRLSVSPRRCAAVEDSHNGLLSAAAAGMRVIAIPNAAFPPGDDALAVAARVLPSLGDLTAAIVEG
jgi:HAD superfamily hydrolase (TIGR01509 family)